jgi:hypothetical protein
VQSVAASDGIAITMIRLSNCRGSARRHDAARMDVWSRARAPAAQEHQFSYKANRPRDWEWSKRGKTLRCKMTKRPKEPERRAPLPKKIN